VIFKRKDSFLFIKPLKPKLLKNYIINLGASFIKLAQVLATRADFFSQDYLDELKELHDQLPPMKKEDFNFVFNESFQEKNPFKSFEEQPIACASIGQVHVAYLKDNTKVAVKLRRRDIKDRVYADIRILNFFNKLFKPLFSFYTKNSIEAIVSEFSKMIKDEVNFNTELANLQKFSNTYSYCDIIFPKPYVEYCTNSSIVMSFEEGFRFDDKENIKKHNIDFKKIINNLVHFYTEQMLLNGLFHADPHPGNILVNTEGEIIMLDFGMVKNVPNDTRIATIELIKAANEQNFEEYVRSCKKLGIIAYEVPTSELAEFTEKMFNIFNNNNLTSESMQNLAFEVLETTKNLPFKLPSDAIYILRVSAIIEGLGTTYIENFNGVKDILPVLQTQLPKALGAKDSIIETISSELIDLPFFIKDLKETIKKANNKELEIELSNNQLTYIKKEAKDYFKSLNISLVLIFSSIFMMLYDKSLKEVALITFIAGIIKILYK